MEEVEKARAPGQEREPEVGNPFFVYAVGDSHVRAFGLHDGFFPLFIGPGLKTGFLSDENAAATRGKVNRLLDLLREGNPVVLVFGEPDVRQALAVRAGDDRVRYLNDCIARYARFLDGICRQSKRKVAVFNAVPGTNPEYNKAARYYNASLNKECLARNIPFVDIQQAITGLDGLLEEYDSKDGVHLNHQIAPLVEQELRHLKIIPAAVPLFEKHPWRYFHTLWRGKKDEVRVWGDVPLSRQSPTYLRTVAVMQSLAHVPLVLKSVGKPQVRILDEGEGLIPLYLSSHLASRMVVATGDGLSLARARELAFLLGREDIDFRISLDGSYDGQVAVLQRSGEPDAAELQWAEQAQVVLVLAGNGGWYEALQSRGFNVLRLKTLEGEDTGEDGTSYLFIGFSSRLAALKYRALRCVVRLVSWFRN